MISNRDRVIEKLVKADTERLDDWIHRAARSNLSWEKMFPAIYQSFYCRQANEAGL